MSVSSRAIRDRVVYRQPNEPKDTREGVLWLDTGSTGRPVKQYDPDVGRWEHVIRVFARTTDPDADGDVEVRDGDLWVDLGQSPPVQYVRDADAAAWEPTTPQTTASETGVVTQNAAFGFSTSGHTGTYSVDIHQGGGQAEATVTNGGGVQSEATLKVICDTQTFSDSIFLASDETGTITVTLPSPKYVRRVEVENVDPDGTYGDLSKDVDGAFWAAFAGSHSHSL